MLSIFLCENDPKSKVSYEKFIESWIIISDYDAKLTLSVSTPVELTAYLKANDISGGLYFIEAEYETSMDGIKLAQNIREHDNEAFIVFIMAYEELLIPAVRSRVDILDYILKTKSSIAVRKCINADITLAMKRKYTFVRNMQEAFAYRNNSKYYTIPIDEVMSVQTLPEDHKLECHTVRSVLQINGDLKEFEDEYDFLMRVHRSVLVNREMIDYFNAKDRLLYLKDGDTVPATKRYMKIIENDM